jgi:hypothetical protein
LCADGACRLYNSLRFPSASALLGRDSAVPER